MVLRFVTTELLFMNEPEWTIIVVSFLQRSQTAIDHVILPKKSDLIEN